MLARDHVQVLTIDFQEKLLPKILNSEDVAQRALTFARFARLLDLPILWTEQYPKGIGPTTEAFREVLADLVPIEKTSFGCFGQPGFSERVAANGRRQLVIIGIEAHVCVLQTALAAVDLGYEVYVVRDAVGSRTALDRDAGLERMRQEGVRLVTVEMAMFEILRAAGTPEFKKVLPLIK